MREIKFRAWHTGSKQMSEPDTLYDLVKNAAKEGYGILKAEIIMQFTGLLDKNGKEIYEGDIVRHLGGVKAVYWDIENVSFQMGFSNSVLDQEYNNYDSVEVIGNIYENKELLG